ncbi:cyclohexanone monooxygenase [Mycobacterium pseudoshottsii JCM 15466]|nr:cyclohexanone monooxygenase [Mycobacterium pseudoshottsii JCM 15466]
MLRQKYAEERTKRLRPDGIAQYVEIAGEFSRFGEDPWADEEFAREPLTDEVDVAIIGAGFGGLLTGARLRQLGVQSVRLIDRAADVGGTWYWNRYPGIACDVESYVYMPLLEELGYIPTEKYAKGAEIFAHCQRIAAKYDLYRDACLQTDVHEIRWDADISRWIIRTNHGDRIRARFVSVANGYQAKPKLPGIAGIASFGGKTFHTSRWDYGYTGQGLQNLADKRVGIIGTGATAVQCVPHVAAAAQQLYVFQRTPSSVDVRANEPTDTEWAATLQPGWQRRRITNFQVLTAGGQASEDLVADAWTSITRKLPVMRHDSAGTTDPEKRSREIEFADFAKMEEIRARVDQLVTDRATAQALKPWYGYFCKRPCFHDEYLQTFNRDNVTLVDTEGARRRAHHRVRRGGRLGGLRAGLPDLCDGVRSWHRLLPSHRLRTDRPGRHHPDRPVARRCAHLSGTVCQRFPELLHRKHRPGRPHGELSISARCAQASHVAWIIAWALEHGVSEVEASPEAEAAWVEAVVTRSAATAERAKTCTPGYYNREGKADAKTRQGSFFFGAPTEYADILETWRAKGDLEGLAIRGAQVPR